MKLLLFLCVILVVLIQASKGYLFPWKWDLEVPTLPPTNGKILGIFGKREVPIQVEQKQSISDGVIVDPDKVIIDGSAGLLKIVKRTIKIDPSKHFNHRDIQDGTIFAKQKERF
uniref:Uncharacterized protein n=1 Tax=Panagrolaimus sp. ES5 TaxID=591445 RepID=A0AC34GDA2_9BILA